MSTITLTLPDDKMARLAGVAEGQGLAVERLLERLADDFLTKHQTASDAAFRTALTASVTENAELLRRLAQ